MQGENQMMLKLILGISSMRSVPLLLFQDGWVGFQTVVIKKPMSALAFYNGYISADRSSGQVFQSQDNFLTKYYSCNKAKSW